MNIAHGRAGLLDSCWHKPRPCDFGGFLPLADDFRHPFGERRRIVVLCIVVVILCIVANHIR